MRAIDTDVLVRLVVRDDPRQVERAEAFVEKSAWVSVLVLAEMTWVLDAVYEIEHSAIATAVEMLLSHESLALQDPDVVAAALGHYRRKPSLGFSDCLILEITKKAGHKPLGTFDKRLGTLDGSQTL